MLADRVRGVVEPPQADVAAALDHQQASAIAGIELEPARLVHRARCRRAAALAGAEDESADEQQPGAERASRHAAHS